MDPHRKRLQCLISYQDRPISKSLKSSSGTVGRRGCCLAHYTAIVYTRPEPVTIQFVDRTFLIMGAVAAFIGVGVGAFGAHGLRGRISPEMLAVFETGVRYQMYHAIAILVTAIAVSHIDGRLVRIAGWLFTSGIVIFSGSLYALALSGISMLGAVTPLGGLAFLAGWACLIIAAIGHPPDL